MELQPILDLERETGGAKAGAGEAYAVPASAFTENACASDTLEAALAAHDWVEIPYVPFPLLLDRPILLRSGVRLTVHPETVLRMMDGCGGCMVRNEHVFDGRQQPCPEEKNDHDMLVEGGVWEYAGSGMSPKDPSPEIQSIGLHREVLIDGEGRETNVAGSEGGGGALLGVFLFVNARNFTVRRLTVRRCDFYGILVAGGDHFVIEDIEFDRNKMDGVHVNGPSSYGLIQRMKGKTGDDFVALNAWDWALSAISFGAIHHILVQDIDCTGDEIRLLPGRKTYKDGRKTECPIHDCLYRRVHNAYCAKLYQQPNCMNDLNGENDKSDIPGEIRGVLFQDVALDALQSTGLGEVSVSALFEICADCTDITFENIRVGVTKEEFRAAGMRLVEVGTKSSTWKRGHKDPKMWAELFDVDLVCTADDLTFRNVTFAGVPCREKDVLVGAHALTVNPDYPNTTPKGGTGKGILGKITIV